MSKTEKRIFRQEALARYMDQSQEAVFPKIIGPKLFPKLWILIALLFAALFLIGWIPVRQEYQLQAVWLPNPDSPSLKWLAIPAHNHPKLKKGLELTVHQGGSVLLHGIITECKGPFEHDSRLLGTESKMLSSVPNIHWPTVLVGVRADEFAPLLEQPGQVQVMLKHPPLRILNFISAINSNNP